MAGVATTGVEIRPVRGWPQRRRFVDLPFRIHGGDPGWVPPLRLGVHDRLSRRHPAHEHQRTQLWMAYRWGHPVGRIGACVDSSFNQFQGVRWGWVGFFDTFDDPGVAGTLFNTAKKWLKGQGADTCVGPANFTTNDEVGLQVEGFDDPPVVLTLQNPRYYEALWTGAGWEPLEDLFGWHFEKLSTALSERQGRVLARIKERSGFTLRDLDMKNFDTDVRLFFDLYNAAWSQNLAFAPMSESEVVHLAKQLKPILNPRWAFGVEDRHGVLIGACVALPDINRVLLRARSGRLLPFNWVRVLRGKGRQSHARVFALGVRPEHQNLAVGPLLYHEIVARLARDPYITSAEGGWTLASNHRINGQLEAMGAKRTKVWRLYQQPL